MALDATLLGSHSDKEHAAPTFKRGYGFHPLCAFVDHGPDGTGEPLAMLLRPGNAGSNTAADHIAVVKDALKQLPGHQPGTRAGRKVLTWLVSQRLSYSVGFTLPAHTPDLLRLIPDSVWTPAYDAHDEIRDGAFVAELTGLLDLTGWPTGMRVIVRKGCGSPRSPPTPPAVSCLTWSCGTAAVPAAKTGSGARKTPA